MDDRNYGLGFSVFPGIGPQTFQKLLSEFGSAKSAWESKRPRLAEIIGEKTLARFEDFRNTFSLEDYAKKLLRKEVSFLLLTDKEYPKLLKEIKNPPIVLYVKGNMEVLSRHSGEELKRRLQNPDSGRAPLARMTEEPIIAIVGTRKITEYGKEVTKLLTTDLVSAGFTIVSGLAIGVDSVAHQTTIDQHGKTIAVLGCGVDCCSPTTNQHIYNSILANGGCIVSEFPLGQPPTQGSFPSRNRIIAGLSLGVLVTEGAEDSGALITADYAFQNQRKVFAVPGPITSSLSKGPYKLLEKGAKLVTSAQDILDEFKMQKSKGKITNQNSKVRGGTEEEREILEILENESLHFDEIVRRLGLTSAKTGSTLSLMEVKGLIKSSDGGIFSIAS